MISYSLCTYLFVYILLVRHTKSDTNYKSGENEISRVINSAELKVQESLLKLKVKNDSDLFKSIISAFDIDKILQFLKKTFHQSVTGLIEDRKIKMGENGKKIIPFLLVPGLLLAGMLPWIVPQLKMMVMAVGFMNQIAFSTALFSFIRGYIFDRTEKEHVFYVNHGYKNKEHFNNDYPQVHSDIELTKHQPNLSINEVAASK
ncbi:hypothetical protein FQR65_LT08848 [Abscondita terminalis]|nr:hypothetical protein FQR65_LT08848 [Abscondita terminalis]